MKLLNAPSSRKQRWRKAEADVDKRPLNVGSYRGDPRKIRDMEAIGTLNKFLWDSNLRTGWKPSFYERPEEIWDSLSINYIFVMA